MPEQLLKNFAIEAERINELDTSQGKLVVYQTKPFGKMLTLNNEILFSESDGFFWHEMISHPALFTHPQPEKVAIMGNSFGIVQEVLKHPNIQEIACLDVATDLQNIVLKYFPEQEMQNDARIKINSALSKDSFDIIIQTKIADFNEQDYKNYFSALKSNGILVHPCVVSLLNPQVLVNVYQTIRLAGFRDWQLLNFPQPSYPSGWRTVMMATKQPSFSYIREKVIYNRPFTTRYYNYDVHKAARALPEFMRELLGE